MVDLLVNYVVPLALLLKSLAKTLFLSSLTSFNFFSEKKKKNLISP